MLKCLIIDDEELARGLLKSYIDRLDFLELIADYEGPLDAIEIIKKEQIDLVFLDIQMPDLKGTDFAKMIDSKIKIIFTTAYSEYALEGFELNAIDYLLKPITFNRFLLAVNRIIPTTSTQETVDTITVKSGYDLHKLKYSEILYIESDNEYVVFYTAKHKIMSHQSLKALEKILDTTIFKRVHRSYIVNRRMVTALKGKDLFIGKLKIRVSDSYYDMVKNELF
jgi:DNA-binding LytR/AlgR family response regulator